METQATPSIAGQKSLHKSLSPQEEKSRIATKKKHNTFIKPNKFHSKYVCFGGQGTREEHKTCLKIRLFGFPQGLVMRSARMAVRAQIQMDQSETEDETTLRAAEKLIKKYYLFFKSLTAFFLLFEEPNYVTKSEVTSPKRC